MPHSAESWAKISTKDSALCGIAEHICNMKRDPVADPHLVLVPDSVLHPVPDPYPVPGPYPVPHSDPVPDPFPEPDPNQLVRDFNLSKSGSGQKSLTPRYAA
jgi:hypothetical protein